MKNSAVILVIVLGISMYIGFFWDSLDSIRNGVSSILDPTFGVLISWNNFFGFLIIVAILSLLLTLAQKFLTDQKELKKLKEEHKEIQKEMKKYTDDKEKSAELLKKSGPLTMKMLHLSMSAFAYTGIPIILFFGWFRETLSPIYGGWWILYYIVVTMIFSSIIRKVLKVY